MFTLGGVHMTRVMIMRGALSLGYHHSIDKLWSHSEHHILLFALKYPKLIQIYMKLKCLFNDFLQKQIALNNLEECLQIR